MIELSIRVKDENTSLVEREVLYDPLCLAKDDITLQAKVNAVMEKFKANSQGDDIDVIIKTKMIW